MKNFVKALVTATAPATLVASMVSASTGQAGDIKLCDITGHHLISAQPAPRATPAPVPQVPLEFPTSGFRG